MNDPDDRLIDASLIRSAVGSIEIPGGAKQLADALSVHWPSVMRMHRRALRQDPDLRWLPCDHRVVPWYRLGVVAGDESIRLSRFLQYCRGDYYLQDSGSMLALAVAGAQDDTLQGKTVCDLCAAPGGKASALVEAVGLTGFVLANEPIRSRVAPLKYNLARTGSDRYAISCMDVESLAKKVANQFDLVLVDAPCSGQALVSRGRHDHGALSRKQIQHSALRQNRILDAAVSLLKPGGRLVYSTCTFATEENEHQIQRLVDDDGLVPGQITALDDYQSAPGCYRLWPHQHQCAGAFAGILENHHDQLSSVPDARRETSRKSSRRRPSPDRNPDRGLRSQLAEWFGDLEESLSLTVDGSVVHGFARDASEFVERVAAAGPELAYRTGRTWKPSHEAAMRQEGPVKACQRLEVDAEAGKAFMAGNAISEVKGVRGWAVAAFDHRPLGWIKSDGRLGKNHLPGSVRVAGPMRA